ncbi:MAG TPA: hypothetical protein VMT39_03000 [Candidatus Bathyarchaeia archaeon]|nr:hypothetical protein [Candidatus Bathyarchaeia archaeon]
MHRPFHHLPRIAILGLAFAAVNVVSQTTPVPVPLNAQTSEQLEMMPPIPVITGGVSFNAQFIPGQQQLLPVVAPIVLVPIGKWGLIESEFEVEAEAVHNTNTGWDPLPVGKSLEYAQLDLFLNRFVTLVGGRFAEPFNIYKERLDARWIRNLQEPPLIFAFSDQSGNGGEVRGGIPLSANVDLNYTGYFSAFTSGEIAGSERQTGLRTSLYFPRPRLEVGFSYDHKLDGAHVTGYGTDITWNMRSLPLDIRAESLISADAGNGYWVEGTWRFAGGRYPKWLRGSQAVIREEQYFPPTVPLEDTELPGTDATRVFVGWNFYLNGALRISAAYGRQFAPDDNHNLWDIGINFRFLK